MLRIDSARVGARAFWGAPHRAALPALCVALLASGRLGASGDARWQAGPADVSVLVHGAPLHGANGLSLGPSSKLYVASALGREIVVMDKGSGQILERYGRADGVETPDDLAFGPDGALYWTSLGTGEVGRLLPGPSEGTMGRFESVARLPLGANSLGFSAQGSLFVGLCVLGAGLFEVASRASTRSGVDAGSGQLPRSVRDFAGQRCGLSAFDFGTDGRIYGPRFFASEVVAIDPETGDMLRVADGFVAPAAAKFGPDGALYVVDGGAGELSRVDVSSGARRQVASIPINTDNLAFDEAGRIFISGLDDGSVHEVLSGGTLRVVSPGGLSFIGGLAVLDDRLFAANLYSLFELDALTGSRRSVRKSVLGAPPGSEVLLSDMMTASASGQELVLSSWLTNTVQVYDPVSAQVVESHGDFNIPMNAIGFEGGLAVAELGSGSVVLEREGARTTLGSGFLVPTGLAALGGALYVADFAAGTLTRVAEGSATLVASELVNPEGLAVNAAGHLLVVESGAGRVSEVDPTTGERRTFAEGLELGLPSVPGYPPSYAFNGIAVGAEGRVYVAGDVTSDVYVLTGPAQHVGP
jgi:sugar lactone lactonase YvrE